MPVFARKYNSFSGVNIKGVLGDKQFASFYGIQFAIERKMNPIYTMNQEEEAAAFARGRRTIAGSLVFVQFDIEQIFKHVDNSDCPVDEIPPFDIVMTVSDESENLVEMKIHDVKLLNSGKGCNVYEVVNDNMYTFVAQSLSPWTPTARRAEILVKQDEHEGMIQNPITGEWRWF